MRHDSSYLENFDQSTPLNRLALGAVDDVGAKMFRERQTTYDGYVSQLCDDLWALGFREPDVRPGIFGPRVRDMVLTFQRISLTAERARAPAPVTITFTGRVTGEVDEATRREIMVWKKAGYLYARDVLAHGAIEKILTFTAMKETGRPVERQTRRFFDPEINLDVERQVPIAYQFLREDVRDGLRVGLLGFSQRSGWLGRYLSMLYEMDPDLLLSYLGPAFKDTYNVVNGRTGRARMSLRLEASDDWAKMLWDPRCERAARYLPWERIIMPLQDVAEANRIRTIKGLAFLFDVAWTVGLTEATMVADACGYRDLAVPVEQHLQPGLYVLRTILPPDRARLIERFEEIVAATDLDSQREYYWNVKIELMRKFGRAPSSL